jgi:two-component system, NarL family, response regulator NreC
VIHILLAEQQVLVRQGVRALLEREVGMEVVGEAGDGWEAVELAREQRPDVAVLDVDMPALNGIEAVNELEAVSPATRSILLTSRSEDCYVLRALQAGASGYVLKIQACEDLVRAICEVRAGRVYLSPSISRAVVEAYLAGRPAVSDPLTARERQLLKLIAEGKSTKEAAALMGIRAKTGESHRTRMMAKLGLHSTAVLVRYAIRVGLVQP